VLLEVLLHLLQLFENGFTALEIKISITMQPFLNIPQLVKEVSWIVTIMYFICWIKL
jgi:hypothetical protein